MIFFILSPKIYLTKFNIAKKLSISKSFFLLSAVGYQLSAVGCSLTNDQ
ncbi:MAG TPA: hypothetical protein PK762_10105 [Candidatus Kapabacteria bacterium]|nr:hypothetical protein [Candidatus Kapabacteria bacterium]